MSRANSLLSAVLTVWNAYDKILHGKRKKSLAINSKYIILSSSAKVLGVQRNNTRVKKNYILRENAITQKTVFMDACTHTMGRLTALGVCFVTWLDINALWRKGIKICISLLPSLWLSQKKIPLVLSTHMVAGSKQEWKTDEFGFIHLNNIFTYNTEALLHAKKTLFTSFTVNTCFYCYYSHHQNKICLLHW